MIWSFLFRMCFNLVFSISWAASSDSMKNKNHEFDDTSLKLDRDTDIGHLIQKKPDSNLKFQDSGNFSRWPPGCIYLFETL